MVKCKVTNSIILMAVMSLLFLSGCVNKQDENSSIQSNKEEIKEIEEEKIIESPDIPRESGYNSIELNFYTPSGNNAYNLEMDIEIYAIYNNTEAYYTLEEAEELEVIKEYKNNGSCYTFLLKEGYKFNAKLNPSNKESLTGWKDYKSNFPFEITAIKEGNNKLNRFNITFDYKSDIVDTSVETLTFD